MLGIIDIVLHVSMFVCLGFGVEAACLYTLAFVNTGSIALIFLTVGIASSGITVSGNHHGYNDMTVHRSL